MYFPLWTMSFSCYGTCFSLLLSPSLFLPLLACNLFFRCCSFSWYFLSCFFFTVLLSRLSYFLVTFYHSILSLRQMPHDCPPTSVQLSCISLVHAPLSSRSFTSSAWPRSPYSVSACCGTRRKWLLNRIDAARSNVTCSRHSESRTNRNFKIIDIRRLRSRVQVV